MSLRLRLEIHEQKLANQSTAPFAALYASHRACLTAHILAVGSPNSTLCVLGAGNCHDVDLTALLNYYSQVHLVDLDESALERVRAQLAGPLLSKLFCHAPLDLSGMLSKLDRWQRFQLTPEELMGHPTITAAELAVSIGGPFDVVVSACVVTQMQLAVLNALTDQHQLFTAIRHTLTVTHLRTLCRLMADNGRGVLASDVCDVSGTQLCELDRPELVKLKLDEVLQSGDLIYVANPRLFGAVVEDDPILKQALRAKAVADVWLWQQGPGRRFLVYAMDLERRDTTMASIEAP